MKNRSKDSAANHGDVPQLHEQDPALTEGSAPFRSTWPIVLGIDPGTRVVGYGAIVARPRGPRLLACGALRADRNLSVPERLGWILDELDRLLLVLKPTVVVVEQAFAARNVQSALRIGEGRGVVLACAAAFGAMIEQFAPAVAKKALIGNGAADKTQVAWMVGQLLGLEKPPEPLDATDALALALAQILRASRIRPSAAEGCIDTLPPAIAAALRMRDRRTARVVRRRSG